MHKSKELRKVLFYVNQIKKSGKYSGIDYSGDLDSETISGLEDAGFMVRRKSDSYTISWK